MGTLSTELSAWIERLAPAPRIYVDANVPAGLVSLMRQTLGWDVFFVMEHAELRRARDIEHFRLARQMHRTLVTLDHDYFDDRQFPLAESSGVVVLSAPDEIQLAHVLRRLDRQVLRVDTSPVPGLPLAGRKVHAHPGWPRAARPPRANRRR